MALPSNYKQVAMPSGNSSSQRLRASGGSSSGDRGKDISSPFLHSPHGNPAFTPQKIGKGGVVVDPRAPKPPKPPEKPLMPFMRYSRKVWDQVKTANPELKLWEVSKIIAQMWKEAPESERQEFVDEYEAEKTHYVEALKGYHATPEYGAWNRYHVNRLKGADGDEPTPRSSSKSQQQERRWDIQPAEDEDDQDDAYTFKHVAYARFLRNHRLINEIFSDAVVPDVRSVVTTQRMQVLKRQVQSLTMHQMKLETELQQIEEKFEAKKRKFIDSSEQFQEELKKHCKPAVDEDTFKKMVERQFETIRRERQRQLEEPKAPVPKPEETVTPSGPNTTIRQNEVDQPGTSEVLQPMETEATPVIQKDDKTLESEANSPAVEAPSTATPVEDNADEKMDIEPPTATPASDNDIHPSSNNQTNNPSDIQQPHHLHQPQAYVTSPSPNATMPSPALPATLAPPPSSSPPKSDTPSPTNIPAGTLPPAGGPVLQTQAPLPGGVPQSAVGPPPSAHHANLPLPPAPAVGPPVIPQEAQPVSQTPVGTPPIEGHQPPMAPSVGGLPNHPQVPSPPQTGLVAAAAAPVSAPGGQTPPVTAPPAAVIGGQPPAPPHMNPMNHGIPPHGAMPPYGGYGPPPGQPGVPATGARPYYPPYAGQHGPPAPPQPAPYGYPQYPPYHHQYGPPPPSSHYMVRPPGMHYPEHTGGAPPPHVIEGQPPMPPHGHYGAPGGPPVMSSVIPGHSSGPPVQEPPAVEDGDEKGKKEGDQAKKE